MDISFYLAEFRKASDFVVVVVFEIQSWPRVMSLETLEKKCLYFLFIIKDVYHSCRIVVFEV